jgi:hypothetical protein
MTPFFLFGHFVEQLVSVANLSSRWRSQPWTSCWWIKFLSMLISNLEVIVRDDGEYRALPEPLLLRAGPPYVFRPSGTAACRCTRTSSTGAGPRCHLPCQAHVTASCASGPYIEAGPGHGARGDCLELTVLFYEFICPP